jgi:beta-phosphoglucomutase
MRWAERYAAVKQEHLVKLMEAGEFTAYPDAIRFVLATKAAGIPIAAASSSKNADLLLRQVRLDDYVAEKGLDLLDADVSGRDLPRGKPDPMIFLVAAEELPATPARCFVVEDAAVGVQAAKAGGMAALGVARLGDEQAQQALADAGADLVVRTLDEVSRPALAEGRLALKTEG